jgi:signal transduction histidine kinase/CheY-like chemotaxis protein
VTRAALHLALAVTALAAAFGAGSAAAAGRASLLGVALAAVCACAGAAAAVARAAARRRRAELVSLARLEQLVAERTAALDAARAQLGVTDRLAAVGRLAAGVAHEVNNPLAVTLTNVGWVAEALRAVAPPPGMGQDGTPTAEEILSALDDAERAAHRVADIVRDLRDFSGERPDGPGAADLVQVVQHVRRLVGHEVRARARLAVDLPEAPLFVAGSPPRLAQLVTHLVLHAALSVDEGAPEANEVRVGVRRDGAGSVLLEVSDTGRGLSADALAHVFDPFYAAWTTGDAAHGLGLAVCHGLVRALGGEIAVESEPGAGSTARVRLADAPSAARFTLRASSAGPARPRVLVVDDEPLVVASLYRVLSRRFDVVPHTSARHALALVQAGERFDAVLCDLTMPELSGATFYEEVRRARPEVARAIVFLTGGAFTDASQRFIASVPNPRLAKPYDPTELIAALEERCASRAAAA